MGKWHKQLRSMAMSQTKNFLPGFHFKLYLNFLRESLYFELPGWNKEFAADKNIPQ